MNLYKEEDYLQLSGIQHFAFCRRQWALAYIELQWQENVRTAEGRLMHEKAHDETIAEKRGDLIVSRAMPVHSRTMGVSGECDVVEFHRIEKTRSGGDLEQAGTLITLSGREGLYAVVPVEYKRGKPKENDIDRLQLTAQALCLEEMLCCTIPYGYLYYGETRHRTKVAFEEDIRKKTADLFQEMHQYYARNYTPRAKRTKSCNACSLQDICLPALGKKEAVSVYMKRKLEEEAE